MTIYLSENAKATFCLLSSINRFDLYSSRMLQFLAYNYVTLPEIELVDSMHLPSSVD